MRNCISDWILKVVISFTKMLQLNILFLGKWETRHSRTEKKKKCFLCTSTTFFELSSWPFNSFFICLCVHCLFLLVDYELCNTGLVTLWRVLPVGQWMWGLRTEFLNTAVFRNSHFYEIPLTVSS